MTPGKCANRPKTIGADSKGYKTRRLLNSPARAKNLIAVETLRRGNLTCRERTGLLLDESTFQEVGSMASFASYDNAGKTTVHVGQDRQVPLSGLC